MNKSLAILLVVVVFAFLSIGTVASAQAPDGAPHERVQQQRAPAACPPDIQWGCVLSGSTSTGLTLNSTSTANNATALYATLSSPGSGSAAVWGRVLGAATTRGYGVYGSHQGSGYGVFGNSNTGIGFYGYSNTNTGMQGQTNSTGASPGVLGEHSATSGTGAGVEGRTNSTSAEATGVLGQVASTSAGTDSAGVRGINNSSSGAGVHGESTQGTGVHGESTNSYGLYATSGNALSWAGYFQGDVYVVDLLRVEGHITTQSLSTSGSKDFRIDHPLDPANQYLHHAAIESSEVLNQYMGNVVLDANGEAVVELPAWFEAINTNFRYQLTAIGAPGPNLYIAEKVDGNRFKIAGGTAGMEVSWLVAATRSDPYMQDHPFEAERAKPEEERGLYVYPEGYGQPESRSVDAVREHPPARNQEMSGTE